METGPLAAIGRLFQSMYWTQPVALFFIAIGIMFVVMGVLQHFWPTVERKGFLPMATTRGDRLFIGLLGSAWIHLGWLALTVVPLWGASVAAVIWFAIVMRYG